MYPKLSLITLFLFILELCIGQPFSMDEELSFLLPDLENACIIWGDYDGDSDQDILQTGNNGSQDVMKLYRNENGSYSLVNTAFNSLGNARISWCDFDNDNDLDILQTGVDDNNLAQTILYRNLGQDLFEEVNSNILGVKSGEICWGDLDNDGDQDLIMVGEKGDEGLTRLYRNSGNDSFESMDHDFLGIYKGDVDLGDYDNDLDLDVLMIGFYLDADGLEQKALKLYRNEGDFSFIEISAGFVGMSESNIQWADYDADGDLDILANGSTEAPTHLVYLYKNQGNDDFLNIGIEIYGTVKGTVNWCDYDNDGDLDFLLTGMPSYGSEPITEIYRNISEDLFNKENNQALPGIFNSSTAWSDYDNDGDLDVIMTGQQNVAGDFISEVYKNKNEGINQVPTIPQNLETEVDGSSIMLTWGPAIDPETLSENITYNVKIGSSSGMSDVYSPMANNDGFMTVNQFGNAGYNTSLKISNLIPGEYYWSVQAIDNNYAGSSFSNEEIFIVNAVNLNEKWNLEHVNIFPNPFNKSICFEFLKNDVEIEELKIINSSGKIVKDFIYDFSVDKVYWNGQDNSGAKVDPGIYLFEITDKGKRSYFKLLKY